MAKLRFRQENDQDTKIALYMSSKDGEEVKLSSPCDCDGQVSLPVVSLQCYDIGLFSGIVPLDITYNLLNSSNKRACSNTFLHVTLVGSTHNNGQKLQENV